FADHCLLFPASRSLQYLHSFPTRRSSDLFSSSAGTFGAVSVRKINSFFSSCSKQAIITDSARASLRDFFHAQIGQKRFLQVFPYCCFFFSMLSSATTIIIVLHSFSFTNIF